MYVGSSSDLKRRANRHFCMLRKGNHHAVALQAAWNFYGDKLVFKVIIACDVSNLIMYEQIAMDALKPRMNTLQAAGSNLGFRQSENTRKLISEAGLGRKHSDESKALMSEKLRAAWARKKSCGKSFMTDEWRANLAASRVGKKLSEEAKKKVSEARLAYWKKRKESGA